MGAVNYQAKRSITGGHVLNTNYDLDIILEQADDSVAVTSSEIKSLGGNQETVLQNIDFHWQISIGSITSVNKPAVREFLNSVQGGEVFTLDVYGSVAVPDAPVSVVAKPGYQFSRVNNSDLFTVALKVREV